MKRLMKLGMLSVAMLVLMCGAAGAQEFNAKASVIVPTIYAWYKNNNNRACSYIHLTNITDKNINCKVTVYDQDGTDVTVRGCVFTGSYTNNYITLSQGIGDFEIPAHSSRVFGFNISQTDPILISGSAVVEWSSDDPMLRKALVGTVKELGFYGYQTIWGPHTAIYTINNGQPF